MPLTNFSAFKELVRNAEGATLRGADGIIRTAPPANGVNSSGPYTLVWAGKAGSGLSFGISQLDISHNSTARLYFEKILDDGVLTGKITQAQSADFLRKAIDKSLSNPASLANQINTTGIFNSTLAQTVVDVADDFNLQTLYFDVMSAANRITQSWAAKGFVNLGIFSNDLSTNSVADHNLAIAWLAGYFNQAHDPKNRQRLVSYLSGTYEGDNLQVPPDLRATLKYFTTHSDFYSDARVYNFKLENLSAAAGYITSQGAYINTDSGPYSDGTLPIISVPLPDVSSASLFGQQYLQLASYHVEAATQVISPDTIRIFGRNKATGAPDSTNYVEVAFNDNLSISSIRIVRDGADITSAFSQKDLVDLRAGAQATIASLVQGASSQINDAQGIQSVNDVVL